MQQRFYPPIPITFQRQEWPVAYPGAKGVWCSACCVLKAQNIDIQPKQCCTWNRFSVFTEEQQGPKIYCLNHSLSSARWKSIEQGLLYSCRDCVLTCISIKILEAARWQLRTHPVHYNIPCTWQCCCDTGISGSQSPSSSHQVPDHSLVSKPSLPHALLSHRWPGHTSRVSPFQSDPGDRTMSSGLLSNMPKKEMWCGIRTHLS